MQKELGLFPLNLVAFPGEHLNLHVFEPRYKQLVNDCLELSQSFGIPSYVRNKIEYGTEVRIIEVTKVYDDGRMDIKTEGVRHFKVVDYHNPWQHRLYAGGPVEFMQYDDREDKELKLRMVDLLHELFHWLHMEEQMEVGVETPMCEYIHKIGLKPDEEYDLLLMQTEEQRQQYVINHLKTILPALERAEKAREKIRLNGHFKHFDPLNF